MVWPKIKKAMLKYFTSLRWYTIAFILMFYAISSWLLLRIAGESDFLGLNDFIYWLVVTGSTVGYGDMSPTTNVGKFVVALYVIPLGLSIFALVVGRIAGWVARQWQKGNKGMHDLNVSGHILVLGWNEKRTLQLLQLLLKERQDIEESPDIVLCVRVHIENPMPGEIEFVHVNSFNRDDDMDRACIAAASTILIDNPMDDLTMTTALYCSQRNPKAHKVAYFDDETLVPLLQKHCPEVECTPSVAIEMLAKSAFDPGSSRLHHDLLDVHEGQAQFSITIPEDVYDIDTETLFYKLKKHYNATFIGFSRANDTQNVVVNPEFNIALKGSDKIFYIAHKRINKFDWPTFVGANKG
ncbi:MAG: potassium channel family protein [Pseudomonadota bacterium]